MYSDRWHEIESLYHLARQKAPEDRTAYLERACEGDESLRREVESLLSLDKEAATFLETEEIPVTQGTADPSLRGGEQIGPYTIQGFLEKGGMGEVYKARDTRLDRTVAVKFLPASFAEDPAALGRFEREARAASALNHPRICTIHDIGEYQGRPFLVMEFLSGQSLRDYILGKPIPIQEIVDLSVQVCDALVAAHAHGIVHRDIKPGNIFVTGPMPFGHSQQIKILDFGLAKVNAEAHREPGGARLAPADTCTSIYVTRPGSLMGTLAYLSPEQARGEEVDARTDIYSFGVVMYEMATGHPAFQAETTGELIGEILYKAPERPSVANPSVTSDLERIILKALEKDRAARYQSARELLTDLEKLQHSMAAAPRTRRWLITSTGVAAAALAGGVFLPRLPIFAPRRKITVAVLPLVEANPDPKQDYFAAGLHDQIIAVLRRLYPERLAVVARSSVKRYQEQETRVKQAADELKVDYVVDAGVRRDADRVRITAQLIRSKDRAKVWSETYDRDLSHILALQAEIAQAVAQGIEGSMKPNPEARMALNRSLNPEAYEAYLRRDYAKSIELDPYYAPAYVGLANKQYLAALFGYVQPLPVFAKMLEVASKAVELDGTLSSAHATLAMGKLHYQWKWRDADQSFIRALQLDPGNSDVLHGYAHFLLWANRGRESAEVCNRALALDPFDPDLIACMAWHSLWAGDYNQAIESARRALSFDPKQGLAALVMGWTYEQKGMFQEALSALEKAFRSTPQTASVAHTLARSGKEQAARDVLGQLLEESKKKYVSAYDIAVIYTGLGEIGHALEWLNKAFDEHSGFMVYVYLDPRLKTLRSDRRFQELLQRMGFENHRA